MGDELGMPQPLSKVVLNPNIAIDALYVYNYPDFCGQIMRVIAHWAHIDGNLATILTRMLKADIEVGAAMYTALSSAEARKSALLAAAKIALSEIQFLMLRAVLKTTAHSRSRRNEFAHHVWGVCEQIPDSLLLLHPNIVLAMNVSYRQRVQELPEGRGVIAPKNIDFSKIFVFTATDFQKSVEDASLSEELFKGLYRVIYLESEEALNWLLNAPQVRQALQPMILESSPATQQRLNQLIADLSQ